MLSAYFILAANSWMQHPVGSVVNPATGRAELTDFWAVLTNSTALGAFPHTITAAFLTAGVFMVGICAWHLARRQRDAGVPVRRCGSALVTVLIAGVGVAVTGDLQARLMTEQQPMKMAAAEALCDTERAGLVLAVRHRHASTAARRSERPGARRCCRSWPPATPTARSRASTTSSAPTSSGTGPGDYRPNVPVAYWAFRLMIGFGCARRCCSPLARRCGCTRGGPRADRPRWFWMRRARRLIGCPFAGQLASAGSSPRWAASRGSSTATLRTADGVSPSVGTGSVATSLIVFTLLYGVLAVVEVGLLVRYARKGPDPPPPPDETGPERRRRRAPLAFAY